MSFILFFLKDLKKPLLDVGVWVLGFIVAEVFSSLRKCLNHYFYCAQFFLGSMSEQLTVITLEMPLSPVMGQYTGALGSSWPPAAVNSTCHGVDECCIAHIPCGINVAVGWQDFLPAWKVRLEFYWVMEPVGDWGRCSKYCLYVWLCIDFCCCTVVWFFSKKGIWNEFVPPLLSTVIHPGASFPSVFLCVIAA